MKTKILLLFLLGFINIASGQIIKPSSTISLENIITNIKDITEIFFYVGTGIIAYFTYRRAKITILQPVRTEKQLDSLDKLLQYINEQDYLLEKAVDYNDIVRLNIIRLLNEPVDKINTYEFGDKLKNDFEMGMSLPCGENEVRKKLKENKLFEKGESNPIVDNENGINLIYITDQYLKFTLKISEFEKNPYMPSKISEELKKLNLDIDKNLCVILKKQLEEIRQNYINGQIKSIDLNKEINNFNRVRIQHQVIREKIREEIRKYLMID